MNYKAIYDKIIIRAKNRALTGYKERHHVIPRCLGGDNSKNNMAELTAKEHFICHRLLVLIYPNEQKLKYALWCMCTVRTPGQKRYKVSARVYDIIRKEYAILSSQRQKGIPSWNKGKKLSDEAKKKMSLSKKNLYASGFISKSKGKKLDYKAIWVSKGMSEEDAEAKLQAKYKQQSKFMKGDDNPFKTLEQTPERRKMLSERAKETFTGSKQSEEHKKKRSESYVKTYANYTEEQKEQRKKMNKANRKKQLEALFKVFEVKYKSKVYLHKGNYNTLSKYLLDELNIKVPRFSLSTYFLGKTKSFKNAPGLSIISLQSNI